jgi:hypothetical protein
MDYGWVYFRDGSKEAVIQYDYKEDNAVFETVTGTIYVYKKLPVVEYPPFKIGTIYRHQFYVAEQMYADHKPKSLVGYLYDEHIYLRCIDTIDKIEIKTSV